MKKLVIATLSAALLIPTVVSAADLSLAPGKPAGVRAAQEEHSNTLLFVGLGAAAVVVIAVAAGSGGNNNTPAVVTPSTGTA